MYQPRHFEQADRAALRSLMRAHPLASLVCVGPDGAPDADPVPLLYDEDGGGAFGTLRGHVARANPLWKHADGRAVLAVFNGPQGYVSPNWYPSKAEHHKAVPTWNYTVVHAHGTLRAIDDPVWLRAFVTRLTQRHEAGRPAPWSLDEAPQDFVQQMLRAIVGIEIPLTRLVGKWKLSQNRAAADREGTAAGLGAGSEQERALAALVSHPQQEIP